jgi:S1-C subfamily serine protease
MHDHFEEVSNPELEDTAEPGNKIQARIRRFGVIAGVLIASLLGAFFYNYLFPNSIPPTQEEIDQNVLAVMASATPPAAYSSHVYQAILPSLVLIQAEGENLDQEEWVGVGSGVVINAGGDILTSLHVVENAAGIEVGFADGTQTRAEVIFSDPNIDIALLHPERPPDLIVPAIMGNPGAMRIGDEAFAVGNPLGLTGSLSAGVISGFDRSVPFDNDSQVLEGLIQFDAAVNPGNSGGPLLNRSGQVIGIVTALANPSRRGSFSGIGFAVPITTAGGAAGMPEY